MTDLAPSAPKFTSFREVIDLWPSREALAAELPGVSNWNVSKWWQRDRLPAEYWVALTSTGRARDAGVTADVLASLAAVESAEVRA